MGRAGGNPPDPPLRSVLLLVSHSSISTPTQSDQAAKLHDLARKWEITCIDCHKGIAHTLPKGHNAAAVIDKLHERFEAEKISCRDCHKGMAAPSPGDDW